MCDKTMDPEAISGTTKLSQTTKIQNLFQQTLMKKYNL